MLNSIIKDLLQQEVQDKKRLANSARCTRLNHQKGKTVMPSDITDRRKDRTYKAGPVITYNLKDLTRDQAEQLGLLTYWQEFTLMEGVGLC